MAASDPMPMRPVSVSGLAARYEAIRAATRALAESLSPEDAVVQSMPDASPAKWHLAHTSWFFEAFLLVPHLAGHRIFHPRYGYLFNSYYESVGARHPRPQRGLLTRPSLAEVLAYRAYVDEAMARLLARPLEPDVAALVELGLNHEQQHQELLLMDIKHLFSLNPLLPAWRESRHAPVPPAPPLAFVPRQAGLVEIGHAGEGFAFDNELPRHRVHLAAYALASRPVTNGEYIEFIRAGGYRRPELWLADGWAAVQREGWERPLYWQADLASVFTLAGLRNLDPNELVCHVSWYEADAFARWAGARLPTEFEWEAAAAGKPVTGNFLESGRIHPAGSSVPDSEGFVGLFGDVWEWTASAYAPYPGFRPAPGAVGEYNGKFMANQYVLRGGCCATPASHLRATYRNFFYPHQRWQFAGIRLARDTR
ncbi:MAG TPA: ergothioneine biosynthesis protein EgtB [Gammaproteobacteria bacterium]|nr:ergothioneine biosynthesis protein EgtB [Gammaproteobacteria bacterium]